MAQKRLKNTPLFISPHHRASSSISTCPTRADQRPTTETPGFANLHAKYAQPGLHVCQLTLSFVSDREITCTLDKTNVHRNPNKITVTKLSRWSLPKKFPSLNERRSETKGNYATLWQLSVCVSVSFSWMEKNPFVKVYHMWYLEKKKSSAHLVVLYLTTVRELIFGHFSDRQGWWQRRWETGTVPMQRRGQLAGPPLSSLIEVQGC